ncbi:cell division protein FtsQ/DivIB [Aliiglaciecola litoralis]|uniref:Cell division protein FtsQ n=1 Tax=Aliiglaciecola litoralis TaxID=582857 RepID=A0ABN1LG38_9ALTE
MQQLEANNTAKPPYQMAGLVFLVTVLLGLCYAAWAISHWLEDSQKAPINQVLVTGNRVYIDDALIENVVRKNHPESFFELNVDRLHQQIEALPWVYRASVRKRWPNSLNVHIVEEIASAKWNSDSLLNQYGQAFDAQLVNGELPDLFGPGGSEKVALQGYRDMQTLLNSASLTIDELYLSERFAWNLRLKNGVRLNLGRSEYLNRLHRFVEVYPLLKDQGKQIDYVDLRYDTGLAVGWKDAEKTKQES